MKNKKDNLEKAYELKKLVSDWVKSFNFIQLNVVEVMARNQGEELFELIQQKELTHEDLAEWTNEDRVYLKRKYPNVEDHPAFNKMMEQKEQDNYPMWNTLFEFKEEPSGGEIDAAKKAGFGIIEGLEDFNTMLFVSGCGYSFYGAHWIPMFLALPWNEKSREEYKGVDYSMM